MSIARRPLQNELFFRSTARQAPVKGRRGSPQGCSSAPPCLLISLTDFLTGLIVFPRSSKGQTDRQTERTARHLENNGHYGP